jgi:[acyl-carrier-protein] S-malonyltransferase
VVVAGDAAAVGRLVENARSAGAKRALVLPVSVPSHCALMKSATERMSARLAEVAINSPQISVIHNVNVEMASGSDEIKDLLARQISEPVRWVETVNKMNQEGVASLVECGPGKVLCGLSKRINREIDCIPLITIENVSTAAEL